MYKNKMLSQATKTIESNQVIIIIHNVRYQSELAIKTIGMNVFFMD